MTFGRIEWKTKYDRNDSDRATALANALGIPFVTAVLLCNRGFEEPGTASEFLNTCGHFSDPFGLPDMKRAVEKITGALRNKTKIAIYGDYDVDGITSTSALYLYLVRHGADVIYHIPSRSTEGYGMNESAIDSLKERGCGFIITVDTGITAVDEVEYAKKLGMDVVVTDHHEVHGDIPDAPVVNPKRPDCTYGFCDFAGVGVVFKLLCALEMTLHEKNCEKATETVIAEYSDLAALGTVSDVMPLVGENRAIVSYGLRLMNEKPRPGIEALLSLSTSSRSNAKITTSTVGFIIAPKLNAAGRLADATLAVALLLSDNDSSATEYAQQLLEMNRERQREETAIFKSAVETAMTECDLKNDSVLVLAKEGWHHGVIGIVASRITEKFGIPSVLISFDENGIGKGSGRSVKGLNLVEALSSCSDCLEKFGGHELAAGLSVTKDNFEVFRKKINEYAKTHMSDSDRESVLYCDCELEADEITEELVSCLDMLEPYGTSNPQPTFVLRNAYVKDVTSIGEGKHTKFVFEKNGVSLPGIVFNVSSSSLDFCEHDRADIIFLPGINEYRNIRTVQLMIQHIRLCDEQYDGRNKEVRRYEEIKSGGEICGRITPRHDEFAKIYRAIRQNATLTEGKFTVSGLSEQLDEDRETAYLRTKFILDILSEMSLIDITENEHNIDLFTARVIPVKGKTNLDRSEIYKSLKARNSNYGRKI